MENIIISVVLLAAVLWASLYIRKEKKQGKCIGCPSGGCKGCTECRERAEKQSLQ